MTSVNSFYFYFWIRSIGLKYFIWLQDDVDDANDEDVRLVIDPHNVEASFAFQVAFLCLAVPMSKVS